MVELRMDPRLRARLGASDVLQDAFVEASERLGDYLADPRMPFFLWLRFITAQRLLALHRRHLEAKKRDARRQVAAGGRGFPAATSIALAANLVDRGTTPTEGAVREELRRRLEDALDKMTPQDREVLVLRHFEELSNAEAARELGIEESAASKRYLRALKRLREVLEAP
jgi:RNA polymerase sigma-70 factor (ECF subfamily)